MKFIDIKFSRDKDMTIFLKIEFKHFRVYGRTTECLLLNHFGNIHKGNIVMLVFK
jgi:hypothetical protein